ncbi:MAG TPA: alkene reductase [Polyangiaceae bacterium]|nr:alkene reductase [Polyangiaceae bacterium]
MSTLPESVLSTYERGPFRLPNRVVMAPMTRSRAGHANVVAPLTREYYRQRAGASFIISEATQVSQQGVGYINTPGIYTEEQVVGWGAVTQAVHEAGGRIFAQLWHVGRISHTTFQPGGQAPVAPSAIAAKGSTYTAQGMQPFSTPRALETAEIASIVQQFVDGAKNARRAGFDGVELHGANGYIIDQFLRDGSNQRTDAYGGSVQNRARFLLEVTEGVVGVWGGDRVSVRLSPLGAFNDMRDSSPLATFSHAARELSARQVGWLHVVEALGDGSAPAAARITPELRKLFGQALIANGGYTLETANRTVASGAADLVSFGALFLANPDLPTRFNERAPLNAPDPSTYYGGDARGYTDYPAHA